MRGPAKLGTESTTSWICPFKNWRKSYWGTRSWMHNLWWLRSRHSRLSPPVKTPSKSTIGSKSEVWSGKVSLQNRASFLYHRQRRQAHIQLKSSMEAQVYRNCNRSQITVKSLQVVVSSKSRDPQLLYLHQNHLRPKSKSKGPKRKKKSLINSQRNQNKGRRRRFLSDRIWLRESRCEILPKMYKKLIMTD